MSLVAITGGTGFVGTHLIDCALAQGHQVRALTRRARPPREGVTWVEGALDRPDSLAALVEGADRVIHVAGVINGSAAEFHAGNVLGTEAMVAAATRAGVAHFVHVSSLAAREPGLSVYGRTKAEAEAVVTASGLAWTIIRPPGIYGPGDREIFELFHVARSGLLPLPPAGRLSLVAVGDLCRLLLGPREPGRLYEPDDGHPGGWSHIEFGRLIGRALGRRVWAFSTPRLFLKAASWFGARFGGPFAKLTPDRIAYFCHPDWVADPARHPPADLWRAEVDTPQGLADTARWYKAQGWL